MSWYHFFEETLALTWRNLLKLRRNPVMIFFSLVMPLIWLLMFTQTFERMFSGAAGALGPASTLASVEYIAVFLPAVLIMTAIQASSQSGFQLVADIETGQMDKLMTLPITRLSYLAGKLIADGLRVAIQATVLLIVALGLKLFFGKDIPFAGGLGGMVIVVLLAAGFGMAFAGLSNTVAIRSRNTESTMMISFSLTFPLLFLSTSMIPREMLPDAVQTFADYNPVTYIADAIRGLILDGFDWSAIGMAFGVILIVGIVLHGFALVAFMGQESK